MSRHGQNAPFHSILRCRRVWIVKKLTAIGPPGKGSLGGTGRTYAARVTSTLVEGLGLGVRGLADDLGDVGPTGVGAAAKRMEPPEGVRGCSAARRKTRRAERSAAPGGTDARALPRRPSRHFPPAALDTASISGAACGFVASREMRMADGVRSFP